MKLLSAPLRERLSAETTHFCHCWRIDLRNGDSVGLTNHDKPLDFQGITFAAKCGITPSATEQSADLARNATEVVGVLGSPYLSDQDLQNGIYDGADVSLWLVDWQDTDNALQIMRGAFGQVRHHKGQFYVTIESTTGRLQQPRGRVYQKKCSALLGDKACRVDLEGATMQTLTEIRTGDTLTLEVPPLANFATDWFSSGMIVFQSGDLIGASHAIRTDQVVGDKRYLTLWESLAQAPSSGDRVKLTVGCDKYFATCKDKFSNNHNFRGFPHIPSDHLLVKAL